MYVLVARFDSHFDKAIFSNHNHFKAIVFDEKNLFYG